MRKEVLWAIIAGITFGLVIAFGVVRINSSIKPKGEVTESAPTPAPDMKEFKITLDKPDNEDVITSDSVTISGITKPKTTVVISGEKDDYIALADDKGFFEKEVYLVSGVNQIILTAFDPDLIGAGSQSKEKVLIIYSSAFEEKEASRLEKAANKPKGYLGTVTDITDSTIQIRTLASEIRQISVSGEITVVKTTPANKIVKLTDIAIGDFIVAMGYRNGNAVLSAQRILITPPVTEPKITVAMGKGVDIAPTKSTLVYLFKEGEATKSKSSAIEDDSAVITVTTDEGGKSTLRSVFIIDKEPS